MNFSNKYNSKTIYIFIIILSSLLYFNTVFNNYSIDDQLITSVFEENTPSFKEIFTSYSFSDESKGFNFAYRPVLIASFAMEKYIVGKNNAHFSHFINLLLIILIFCLVYNFMSKLFETTDKFLLFIAMLIFMVHPLLTEIVNNIKSRDELLVAIFGLLALTVYLNYLKTKKLQFLVFLVIFIVLGVLTKKSFFVFSVTLPLVSVFYNKRLVLKDLLISFVFAILPFFTLIIVKKIFTIGSAQIREFEYFENPLYFYSFIDRISTGLTVPLYYIKLFFYPYSNLSFYYGFDVIKLQNWYNILPYFSILFYLSAFVLAIKTFKTHLLLSFGIFLILLQSAAVSNILLPLPGVIADRFYFIGTLGFSMVIAQLFYIFFEKTNLIKQLKNNNLSINNKSYLLLFIILIPFAIKTISRNLDWKNSRTLFEADIEHLQKSAKANELMSSLYLEEFAKTKNVSFLDKSEKYGQRAVSIYPKYAAVWNNLGYINYTKQNFTEAIKAYNFALKYAPENANPLFNLALLYEKNNDILAAKQSYLRILEVNPDLPNYLPYIKAFIIKNKEVDFFIAKINELLKTSNNYNLQILVIDLYNSKADYSKMLDQLKKTYQIYPSLSLKNYIEETKKTLTKLKTDTL